MNRSHPGRHPGLHRLRDQWPLLTGVWGLATVAGLFVAATTSIGPVIISLTRSHGVHLGDVVGFCLFYGLALMVTAWIAR